MLARAALLALAASAALLSGTALVVGCAVDPENLPEMIFSVPPGEVWRSPSTVPPPGRGEGRLLFSNNLDDMVSIVDLDSALRGSPQLLGHVPVGFVPVEREGPHHITVDAEGAFYYVGISNYVPGSGSGPHGVHGNGSADGHLIKVRVDDNMKVADVRIDRSPGDVRLTPDGRLLLATHFDLLRIAEAGAQGITAGPELDTRLAVVDPVTMTRIALVPACPAAHGIAITDDSATAVMSCLSDEVAIVDLAGGGFEVTRLPVVPGPGTAAEPVCAPYAVTMDGGSAWVSCLDTGELVAVDIASRALDGRAFQLQGLALFGAVRDGVMAVAHQGVDGITFFETGAPGGAPRFLSTRLFSPADCTLPHSATFSEGGDVVFVVCEGNKSEPGGLAIIEATPPHALLGKVALGIFPDDVAIFRRPP
jgi:DNA-binding beta-propeller fold protein YncE